MNEWWDVECSSNEVIEMGSQLLVEDDAVTFQSLKESQTVPPSSVAKMIDAQVEANCSFTVGPSSLHLYDAGSTVDGNIMAGWFRWNPPQAGQGPRIPESEIDPFTAVRSVPARTSWTVIASSDSATIEPESKLQVGPGYVIFQSGGDTVIVHAEPLDRGGFTIRNSQCYAGHGKIPPDASQGMSGEIATGSGRSFFRAKLEGASSEEPG